MFDVVISLYNKEKFVAATIETVLAQTFAEWRLFVVDDGSVDRGADIVRQYDDPRIRLIQQANEGVGPARNAGIRAGTAEWIAFLDADDLWNADHLEELDTLRRSFPQAALIGCAFERFSGIAAPKQRSAGSGKRRLARYFAECARGRELFLTSSAAVRRSTIQEVGGFEPLPGNEDVELWARLALHGPVAVSSKRTANYRVATGGLTDQRISEGHKPLRREELSSTIPVLTSRLPAIRDKCLRRDVADYMDSRIGIRMVAALLDGDVAYARQLAALYHGRPLGKARVAALIAGLPGPLARTVVKGGGLIKRTARRLGSR
jgi:glycosyltransferase involved in cell wall biosynthesis